MGIRVVFDGESEFDHCFSNFPEKISEFSDVTEKSEQYSPYRHLLSIW